MLLDIDLDTEFNMDDPIIGLVERDTLLNSSTTGRCWSNYKSVVYEHMLWIMSISWEIAPMISLFNGRLTLLCLFLYSFFKLIITCRLCVIYVREDNNLSV